jgi:hypothetical protein
MVHAREEKKCMVNGACQRGEEMHGERCMPERRGDAW